MIRMEIIQASIYLSVAIVLAALTRLFYHVRPKAGFAQVTIGGHTASDGEAFQATVTLFKDECQSSWRNKLLAVYELKEWRLKYQNDRMQALEDQAKKDFEEAKAKGILKTPGI